MNKKTRSLLTLDQLFKYAFSRYFSEKNFEVHTEAELLTGPKRIDVILIRKEDKSKNTGFKIFDYLSEHNIISYKSLVDKFNVKAVNECFIYFLLYLEYWQGANKDNTTITLITSKISKKVLNEYRPLITRESKGRLEIKYGHANLVILNIEELELTGEDGILLSAFSKKVQGIPQKHGFSFDRNIIDILREVVDSRLKHFEGVSDVQHAVDVTDIMMPKIEEAERRGIEKGIEKGMEKGKIDAARSMLVKGFSLSDISDITGLSVKEIKALKE